MLKRKDSVQERRVSAQATANVVIVAPMLARYDAISAAARDTYRMLSAHPAWDVRVLTLRNDFADVPASIVSDVADLLTHPAYLAADILIYHFGMFNELINALLVGNGHARQIVHFHNITPARYVARTHWRVIEDSFRQIANLQCADEVWAVSVVNRDELEQRGIDPARIRVIPLAVDAPPFSTLRDKTTQQLELMFLGRIVASKGVLDLVQAVDLLRQSAPAPFRLRLAGNLEWSDQDYVRQVQRFVRERQLDDVVEFCGTVTDAERERLYREAHIFAIPSYHEGFCVPVLEALRSGCVPVGYAAYNLPYIANGFGRLVPPGDVQALAGALSEVLASVARARSSPDAPLPLDRGPTSAREFEAATRDYALGFTFERLSALTRDRVQALLV
ncbi:MAG TPA: glycosyltransferase family 4 protein [Ktedonobacterales bacterium]